VQGDSSPGRHPDPLAYPPLAHSARRLHWAGCRTRSPGRPVVPHCQQRGDAPSDLRARSVETSLSQVATAPLLGRLLPSSDVLAQVLGQRADTLLRTLVSAVAGLGEFAVDLVVVLILTYFFATDVKMGEGLLRRWIPPYYGSRARLLMTRLRHQLSRWVWARLAVAVYLGVISSVGLTWLGVPFALTIGLVGGVLEIVPTWAAQWH
jgi:predicted PurR-regulated permease PerM